MDETRSTALFRIYHSIAISVVAAGMFLAACVTSRPLGRAVLLVVQAAWLYVSNTRG
jgi:hypothetical protein